MLPIMTMCAGLSVSTCMNRLHRGPWAAAVGGYAVTFLLQYMSTALLSRWSFDVGGPKTVSTSQSSKPGRNNQPIEAQVFNNSSKTLWLRLKFGVLVATSFRWSGTPYEVKNVPRSSTQDPRYIPSQNVFLLQKAATMLICYLALDLLSLGADPKINKTNFSPNLIPLFERIGDVTAQQLMIRLFAMLGFGIGVYCVQQFCHSLAAFIDVALRFNKPESWRPLFGSLWDAYTVRRFWRFVAILIAILVVLHYRRLTPSYSVCWQQNNRQKFSEIVDFVLFRILNISKRNLLTKYSNILLHFLVSGLLHATIDLASDVSWRQSGAVQFFSTQVVGIVLEEIVQHIYLSIFPSGSATDRPTLWARILGYLWLTLFLTWSVPIWIYPMFFRMRGGSADSVLPFSIVARLL